MISRREVVTAGMLGTLSTAAVPALADAGQQPDAQAVAAGFSSVKSQLEELNRLVARAVASPLSTGLVGEVRAKIELYLKTSGKFPEFCEVGTSVFYAIYEWHVIHQQQVQVTRLSEQRLMIQFMYTQLILRWENDSGYIGAPYDR
jgi:hypothetical protein